MGKYRAHPFGNRSQDGVYHLDDQRFCIKRRSLHLSAFFGYLYAGRLYRRRIKSPTSHLQEEYVLQSLGDRSQDVRDEAYKVLSEMTLSPEQNQKVEELLRFKYSEMRINAINLLMKQPKEQLSGSIRRLLTDKVVERRLAGLDMMKTIHNIEFLQDTYRGTDPHRQRNSETERERKSVDRISDWRRNGRKHRTALYQR